MSNICQEAIFKKLPNSYKSNKLTLTGEGYDGFSIDSIPKFDFEEKIKEKQLIITIFDETPLKREDPGTKPTIGVVCPSGIGGIIYAIPPKIKFQDRRWRNEDHTLNRICLRSDIGNTIISNWMDVEYGAKKIKNTEDIIIDINQEMIDKGHINIKMWSNNGIFNANGGKLKITYYYRVLLA